MHQSQTIMFELSLLVVLRCTRPVEESAHVPVCVKYNGIYRKDDCDDHGDGLSAPGTDYFMQDIASSCTGSCEALVRQSVLADSAVAMNTAAVENAAAKQYEKQTVRRFDMRLRTHVQLKQ